MPTLMAHHFLAKKPLFLHFTTLYKLPRCFAFSTVTADPVTLPKTKTFSHIFQDCAFRRALNPGKQGHARMIVTGFQPTVFVTNCLVQMYIKCYHLEYAYKMFEGMPERDVVSWNSIIFGYAGCGKIDVAQGLFDLMTVRDVVSWNTMISGYLQRGHYGKAVEIFVRMGNADVGFDCTTFAIVLKACSGMEDYGLGRQIHGLAVRIGFDKDVVVGSALVDMYGKCKQLDDSICVFDEMDEKNWVSWSALIAACVQNDRFAKGVGLFKEMLKAGVGVSQSTYASTLRSCAALSDIRLGSQLHGHTLKADFGFDGIVGTAVLDMYAKCNSMPDAQKLFNSLPNRSLQTYNAIIVGFARNELGLEALRKFQLLHKSSLGYNDISLSAGFSACALIKGYLEGQQLHVLAVKSSFRSDICVKNAILDMYGKCGALLEASHVFYEMDTRDAVSWNAIIAAYEQNGQEEDTLTLFVSMLRSKTEPDDFTYGSVLKACAGKQALNYGVEIHSRVIKSGMGLDWFVGSALVDMYSKCGMMSEAEKINERIEDQTTVSWNAIISGFSTLKQCEEAQKYFAWMLETNVMPDNFTYATVLDSCANIASVGLGKQIHAQIIKQELQSDVYIASTLVDMYSKCGDMQDSRLVFDKAAKRDFVTWNAMICGYAHHGLGAEALNIFERMQLENVKPNHATFVSVLRACAHMGLVEEGLQYFQKMSRVYGLNPQLEHYSCMVDILGRSGQFTEALNLIHEMPFKADAIVWRTLLSTCETHGNAEVAELAAKALLQLEPDDSATYILLSKIYANARMWTEVLKLRKTMKYNKIKKEPGCSWIEVKDELHTFLVGDKAHPRCEEIYEKLDVLINEMKGDGYVPETNVLLNEEEPLEQLQISSSCT